MRWRFNDANGAPSFARSRTTSGHSTWRASVANAAHHSTLQTSQKHRHVIGEVVHIWQAGDAVMAGMQCMNWRLPLVSDFTAPLGRQPAAPIRQPARGTEDLA
jgi:hypothetical protein